MIGYVLDSYDEIHKSYLKTEKELLDEYDENLKIIMRLHKQKM